MTGPDFETLSVTRTVIVGVPPRLGDGFELLPGEVTNPALGAEVTVSAKPLKLSGAGRKVKVL
jgi:hypothetical protein